MLIRGISFAAAVAKWAFSGRPTRSPEQIENLLVICQDCEQFSGFDCKVCGCNCGQDSTVLNKLYLATEKCPLRKW